MLNILQKNQINKMKSVYKMLDSKKLNAIKLIKIAAIAKGDTEDIARKIEAVEVINEILKERKNGNSRN